MSLSVLVILVGWAGSLLAIGLDDRALLLAFGATLALGAVAMMVVTWAAGRRGRWSR